MIYNVIDLFAGAGGLSLGFKQTGQVKIVAAAENNLNARKTYKRNFKLARLYSDVRTIDYAELQDTVGPVDIVIGGPPCQGFSNANRQHTTVISMNNRLVKEYVRAICELNPKAFVMENVAMLRSQVHRFFLEEQDLDNERIMALPLSEDKIEILPECVNFSNSIAFLETARAEMGYAWAESFYKIINILYRYRINPAKFDTTLEKYQKKLIAQLNEILKITAETEELNVLQENDAKMAKAILQYIDQKDTFDDAVLAISNSIMMQRAIMKIKELTDNDIHIFEYKEDNGSLVAVVKSYPVMDYIRAILENEPYNYTLSENTLNAIHYGAPQRRERFIIVGLKKEMNAKYIAPEIKFTEGNYRTVYDAIADIQDVIPVTEVTGDYIGFFTFVVFHFIQGCLDETCQRSKQALGFALVFSTFHFPFEMLWVFKATEIRVDSIPLNEQCASKWNQSVNVSLVFDFHACLTNHCNSSAKRWHNHQFQRELADSFRIIGKFLGEGSC